MGGRSRQIGKFQPGDIVKGRSGEGKEKIWHIKLSLVLRSETTALPLEKTPPLGQDWRLPVWRTGNCSLQVAHWLLLRALQVSKENF